jgi:hypothetical protein
MSGDQFIPIWISLYIKEQAGFLLGDGIELARFKGG